MDKIQNWTEGSGVKGGPSELADAFNFSQDQSQGVYSQTLITLYHKESIHRVMVWTVHKEEIFNRLCQCLLDY